MDRLRRFIIIMTIAAITFVCGLLVRDVLPETIFHESPVDMHLAAVIDSESDGRTFEYAIEIDGGESRMSRHSFTLFVSTKEDGTIDKANIMYPSQDGSVVLMHTLIGDSLQTFLTLAGEWAAIDLNDDGYIDSIRQFSGSPPESEDRYVLIYYQNQWIDGQLEDNQHAMIDGHSYLFDGGEWRQTSEDDDG